MNDNPKDSKKRQEELNGIGKTILKWIVIFVGFAALSFVLVQTYFEQNQKALEIQLSDCKEKLEQCTKLPEERKIVPFKGSVQQYPDITLMPDKTIRELEQIFGDRLRNIGAKKQKKDLISNYRVLQSTYLLKEKRGPFDYVVKVDPKLEYNLSGTAFLYTKKGEREIYEVLQADKEDRIMKFKIKDSNPGDEIIAIIKIDKETGKIESPQKIISWFCY